MTPIDPADRPDPSEQPIRARVPEHVTGGAFSTGVIVMTAQTEFILDFVQNLGRPHQIVSRVVMPHSVLPQLVDALHRNMELYRSRWGELPATQPPGNPNPKAPVNVHPADAVLENETQTPGTQPGTAPASQPDSTGGAKNIGTPSSDGVGNGGDAGALPAHGQSSQTPPPQAPPSQAAGAGGEPGSQPPAARQASAQEIYDDLKIRDELLSGAYANAVMIGHGPHEFSFDFITNFYPHSAVSARVFLAAGQVPRLYESLKGTWEQLRQRLQPPPGGSPPPFPPDDNPPIA